MKLLRIISGLLLALPAFGAGTVAVRFEFQAPDSVVATNKAFNLYPIGGPWTNGLAIITRDRVSLNTGTNSTVTISNLYPGPYRSELEGSFTKTTNWYQFPVTNGLIQAADWVTVPTNGPNGILAYSRAQMDAILAGLEAGTNPTALTNNETRAVTFQNDVEVEGILTFESGQGTNLNIEGVGAVIGTFGVGGLQSNTGPLVVYGTITGTNFVGLPQVSSNDMRKIYVSPSGSASVTGRGTPNQPTSLIYDYNGTTRSGALATATNGDTVIIGPGTYIVPAMPMADGVSMIGIGMPTILRTNRISSTNNTFIPFSGGLPQYNQVSWLMPGDNCRIEGIRFDASQLAPSNSVFASIFVNRNPEGYIPDGTVPNDVGAATLTYLTNGGHYAPSPFLYYNPYTGITNKYSTNVWLVGNHFKSITDIIYPQDSWNKYQVYRYGNTNDPQWITDPGFPDEHNWSGMTWYYTTNYMGEMRWYSMGNTWEHKWDGNYLSGTAATMYGFFDKIIIHPEHPGSTPHGFFINNFATYFDFGSVVIVETNLILSAAESAANTHLAAGTGKLFMDGTAYYRTNIGTGEIPINMTSAGVARGNWIDGSNFTLVQIGPLIITNATGTLPMTNLDARVVTNANATLTSGRVQVGDGGRGIANATASGAVPIDADGTATTFAQVNALAPGYVVTNGNASGLTLNGAVSSTSSNFFGGYQSFPTNQNQIRPDFSIPAQLMSTNANFTFLAPVGVDTLKLTLQTTAIYVTNTAGNSTLTVTAPANAHPAPATGMYVTNVSRFTFECYAQKFTNVYCVPVW